MNKTILLLLLLLPAVVLQAQWKQLPVGSPRGGLWGVAVAGSNVFAGTSGGIFKSNTNGATWKNVSNINTQCFLVKGSEIFAGTLERGAIVSTDEGNTWFQRDPGFTRWIRAFAIKDSLIFAGGAGMFKSTDDGASWITIENGMSAYQAMVTGIAIDSLNLYATSEAGLMISTDQGNSWSEVTSNALPNGTTNCIIIRNPIIMVGTPGGMVRSTDDGISWNSDNLGLPKIAGFYTPILSLAIYQNQFFAGTSSGFYISSDSGASWYSSNVGLPGNQIFSVALNDTDIFAATINNGVYRSIDSGKSWISASSGIVMSEVKSIAGNGPNIYAVMDYDSLYTSTDNGNTWLADTSLHTGEIASVTLIGQKVYASTSSGIYVSSDNGKTWNTINGGIMDTTYPTMLVQSGSNLISATQSGGRVFLSSNNGSTWGNVGQGLPALASLTATTTTVIAGAHDGVHVSTDNGETWTNVNDTLININALATTGSDVFAGRYLWPIAIGFDTTVPGGVFRSTDGGLTWSPFGSGLPPFDPITHAPAVNSIAVHGGYVFAGLYPGLYSSTITDNNWTSFGQNLPSSRVLSLFVNDSTVFAGTEVSGIWCAPFSGVTGVKQPTTSALPKAFQLEQNYPNPFNPSTTISYQLSEVSIVKLNVYDILGRQVATLVNGRQNAGNYNVTFNASNLSTGVYFYKLQAGTYSDTKKLMLIK
jgi:photosystem II stability/assembly factor-like uncharacterized protein